jgi:hypothetical protein
MPRPAKLNPVRHARIVNLLRDGVAFATACRTVGISASAGYEWLYSGWGTHPAAATGLAAFARDVDAVSPGGFAERYEDEFVEPQSSDGTESGRDRENGGETVERPFAEGFSEVDRFPTLLPAENSTALARLTDSGKLRNPRLGSIVDEEF